MNQSHRYTTVAIALHWLIALLIIGQLIGGLVMVRLPFTTLKFEIYQWHKSFGVTILMLSFLRLAWRLGHKPPPLPEKMDSLQKTMAGLSHALLYIFMIAMPLIGWAMVSVSPKNIPTVLFKTLPWPHIPGVPQSEQWEQFFSSAHEYLAYGFIALLVLHVAAALKHHYVDRDDVLVRMAPIFKRKEKV